ncbi:hypothetical protein BXZ70DRAFT_1005403 [Cristinia sonorae]|uniref:Uncharacterized protein n=1 Tax=Cristinia sonorae TaxID=1940300 RepID=A0A8K0UTQ6_9AGAR|nr:hypothetical protein BXZ70DRAFT_1005403 [Cristinia sonorae]
MFAQYSPLFTSGLMSDHPRTPSPPRKVRRTKHHDSLPVTVKSSTSSYYPATRSPESTISQGFMFTLAPHRRLLDEDRSFLSLDLAESQSMRSMSLRRKDTVTTKSSTFFGKSEPSSPVSPQSRRNPFAPQLPSISSRTPSSSASHPIRRSSRDTLRLPSPKPAPSISLPEPPSSAPAAISTTVVPRSRKYRPSNLVITLSACFMEAGPSSTSPLFSPQHRASSSAPSVLSPDEDSYFMFSPTSPVAAAPIAPTPSPLKASLSTRSTATVNTRNRNRSAALAALEGRGPRSLSAVKEDKRPGNFMSMTDDEDEEEDIQVDLMSVLNEEEGLVIPSASPTTPPQRLSVGGKRGRTPTPRDLKDQEETPSSQRESDLRTSSTPSSKRSRRSTIESFLAPLTNFIDFREDDGGRGWRSFVEISS